MWLLPLKIAKTLQKIRSSKCEYFYKRFCKQKSQCDKLHPSTDCDNQGLVKNSCPHRKPSSWIYAGLL